MVPAMLIWRVWQHNKKRGSVRACTAKVMPVLRHGLESAGTCSAPYAVVPSTSAHTCRSLKDKMKLKDVCRVRSSLESRNEAQVQGVLCAACQVCVKRVLLVEWNAGAA